MLPAFLELFQQSMNCAVTKSIQNVLEHKKKGGVERTKIWACSEMTSPGKNLLFLVHYFWRAPAYL